MAYSFAALGLAAEMMQHEGRKQELLELSRQYRDKVCQLIDGATLKSDDPVWTDARFHKVLHSMIWELAKQREKALKWDVLKELFGGRV